MEKDGGSHTREGEGHSDPGCARIIVVGGPVLAEQVIAATDRPVMVVPSFYDAIGELSWSDPERGGVAVIGDVDRIRGEATAFASAIREMAVQTVLIAVHPRTDDALAKRAVDAGFDASLPMPVSEDQLAPLLGPSPAGATTTDSDEDDHTDVDRDSQGREDEPMQSQPIHTEPTPTSTPSTPTPTSSASPPALVPDLPPPPRPPQSASTAEQETGPTTPEPEPEIPSTAAPPPVTIATPAHAEQGDLGDVDLIERLLTNPAEFRGVTLQIVGQHTGLHDLQFADDAVDTGACVPIAYHGQSFGFIVSASGDASVLIPWTRWLGYWLQLERQMARLRRMAFTDQMTGAWNRRYFDSFLPAIIKQARRDRHCVSLLLFDIDDFKYYNDEFGHAAGDEILIETVRLLKSVIRPGDRVCRIGGDEFAVIFYDPTGKRVPGSQHPLRAEAVARRFREQIAAQRFPKLGAHARGRLTISGGIATYPWDGQDAAALIEYADQAAMSAKRAGKNAIVYGDRDSNGNGNGEDASG